MASCILQPRGPWLSLLLVLLLFQPGQHVSPTSKNKKATTSTKPSTAMADCCKDPGKVDAKIAIGYCPLDYTNISDTMKRLEMEASDGQSCSNITHIFSECQGNVSVERVSPLPNCTISTCTSPSPVEGLHLGNYTNTSVILHWQNPVHCCHEPFRDNFTEIPNGGWNNGMAYISGLLPGQEYIIAVFQILDGRCSQEKHINVTTRPSPVMSITVENRSVHWLQIAWTPPSDRHVRTYSYKVCLLNCRVVFSSPLTVGDLQAGITYSISVTVLTSNNISSTAMISNATTAPNRPKSITVEHCSTNNISISWAPPGDSNELHYYYLISWFSESDSHNLGSNYTNGSHYVIGNLQPGSLYLVKIVTTINGITSEDAMQWALTCPLPPPSASFKVIAVEQRTATFSWENPDSNFSGFVLQWEGSRDPRNHEHFFEPSEKRALTGLTPSTNYTFKLFTKAEGKNLTALSISTEIEAATKPESVSDLSCHALEGGFGLQLLLNCPASEISQAVVLVSGEQREQWPTCKTSTVINNLQPARSYQIQVKTFWYNQYVVSDPVVCTTDIVGIITGPLTAACLLFMILVLLVLYFRRKRRNILEKPDTGLRRIFAAVPVAAFPCYCCEQFSDSAFGFAKEYQQLQDIGTGQSQSVAERPENQAKNRYSNVLPYDHARVQLSLRPKDPNSDYINASYMPGYEREKEFIATQGPLPGTLCDFWRLIWEQKVMTLVMLTNCIENGRVKCERYWPLDYTPCTYGDITVSVVTETILPNWTIRDFSIKQMNALGVHLTRHFHYTSWPDHGVPHITSTILHFRDLVREHIEQHESSGPALIHCSAGVGRTGTFIALDSLLCQAHIQGEVGVFSFVQRMRVNRPLMIQTESQYIFLHQCLLDGIRTAPLKKGDKVEDSAVYENTLALQDCEVSRV